MLSRSAWRQDLGLAQTTAGNPHQTGVIAHLASATVAATRAIARAGVAIAKSQTAYRAS
mgnify:CR=1 FL=1